MSKGSGGDEGREGKLVRYGPCLTGRWCKPKVLLTSLLMVPLGALLRTVPNAVRLAHLVRASGADLGALRRAGWVKADAVLGSRRG